MNLTPCDLPNKVKKPPKYMEWVSVIDEFLAMKVECARLDGEIDQKQVQQMRNCITKRYPGLVKMHVLGGSVYLTTGE